MPKTLTAQSVLWAISEEKLGFKFGDPERIEPDSLSVVVPLLRHSLTPRIYTTFPEALADVKVSDTGRIDRMEFRNTGQQTVFVRSGTLLKGATQERTTVRSSIILAGEKIGVEVRCVHATKGIQMGASVGYGGSIPFDMEKSCYSSGFVARDQSHYWNSVRTMCSTLYTVTGRAARRPTIQTIDTGPRTGTRTTGMGTHIGTLQQPWRDAHTQSPLSHFGSIYQDPPHVEIDGILDAYLGAASTSPEGSDDLVSNLDQYAKDIDQLLSKVKLHDDQVGMAFLAETGCESIEVFDAHGSWKALHEDAVKRFGNNLAKKDPTGVFEFKPERANPMIQAVLTLPFEEKLIYEHKPSNGEPHVRIASLTAEAYTGEVAEVDGKMIHLMIIKTAKD